MDRTIFLASLGQILVSMIICWLPFFLNNTDVYPFKVNSWWWRSIWRFLSACDNFQPHICLPANCCDNFAWKRLRKIYRVYLTTARALACFRFHPNWTAQLMRRGRVSYLWQNGRKKKIDRLHVDNPEACWELLFISAGEKRASCKLPIHELTRFRWEKSAYRLVCTRGGSHAWSH